MNVQWLARPGLRGRERPGCGRWTVAAAVLMLLGAPVAAIAGPQKSVAELQAVVDRAAPGAVVTLAPGTYTGELVVRRPLILRGRGATLVHREGAPGPTLSVEADDVRVEGLEVVGTGEGTRRDHTAVVVTGHRAVLEGLVIRDAWAGVWLDGAHGVYVSHLVFRGLADFPFWQRGDGVRVSGSRGTRLVNLDLGAAADGVYLEDTHDTLVRGIRVEEARYGVHVMFGAGGRVEGAATRRTVVGFMAMETADWVVTGRFTEGYRTGSAGVRQIRTKAVTVVGSVVSRQATGFELLDARGGLVEGNRIEENGVAWSLGGDNGGTRITGNTHRSNLIDLSARALAEADLVDADAHNHARSSPSTPPIVTGPSPPRRPTFDGNFWDSWSGWDLDGDGRGDTPHLVDPRASERTATRPWSGVFLGSPWTTLAATIPGGEVLDPRPLVKPPVGRP